MTEGQNIASEPKVPYGRRTLNIFFSLEESNEQDARSMVELSPEEHLKNVTARIQKIYSEELKNPMDKKLKFRNDGDSIPVIHYNDLLLSKMHTGRAKDLADIEELERINKYRDDK